MEDTRQHLPHLLPTVLVLTLECLLTLDAKHQRLPICILLERVRAVSDTLDVVQLQVPWKAHLAPRGTRRALLEVEEEGVGKGLLHLPESLLASKAECLVSPLEDGIG